MKSYKFLLLFLSVLLAAGCASPAAETAVPRSGETAEAPAIPTEEIIKMTAASETTSEKEGTETSKTEESVPEEDGEVLYAEFIKDRNYFREENKPPETEDPTLAEEIYRLLYEFADLSDTLWYIEAAGDDYVRDPKTGEVSRKFSAASDYITAESTWINPGAEPGDEDFALVNTNYYTRIRYGGIKTVNDYYQRMSRVATWEYMALDSPWLGGRIRSSDGNLYVSDFITVMNGSWSDSDLTKITKTDEDTLRLYFTVTHYYLDGLTEDYSVTISKGKSYCRDREPDGKWRVDRCKTNYEQELAAEIIKGGRYGEKTDLPAQIEQCLKESGLM